MGEGVLMILDPTKLGYTLNVMIYDNTSYNHRQYIIYSDKILWIAGFTVYDFEGGGE